MDLKKASLLFYLIIFLHLQHRVTHAISRSTTTPLASVDPIHDNLPVQAVELEVFVKKGGGGGGRGGGGRGFGGRGGGDRERPGRGGFRPIPIYGGGSHHGGHRSSGGRETASGWLGLSILAGLVLVC